MNRIFKTIWSYALNQFVVTDELHSAGGGKKTCRTATAAALSLGALMQASAAPASAFSTEEGWIVVDDADIIYETGIYSQNEKRAITPAQGYIRSYSNGDQSALRAYQSELVLSAPEEILLSATSPEFAFGMDAANGATVSLFSQKEVSIGASSSEASAENTYFRARGISIENGSSGLIEAKKVNVKASGVGADTEAIRVYGGDLTLKSTGTDEDDGIFISSTSENKGAILLDVHGEAELVSNTDIIMESVTKDPGAYTPAVIAQQDSSIYMDAQGALKILIQNNSTGRTVGILSGSNQKTPKSEVTAQADTIDISVVGYESNQAMRIHGGSSVELVADKSINLSVTGKSFGQQQALAVYSAPQTSTVILDAPTITLSSDISTKNELPTGENQEGNYINNSCGYAVSVIDNVGNGKTNVAPTVLIGTDGAELITLNSSISGVGNVSGVRGGTGTLEIGTADRSVISINVSASNNKAAENGYTDNNNALNVHFANGIAFGGDTAQMTLRGKLIDVAVDGGNIRAQGFKIARGGSLQVDAPMLMTVKGSYLPDQTKDKGNIDNIGRRNEGLVIGAKKNDTGGTTAVFNKPVTVIVTNDAVKSTNIKKYQKGQAVAVFIESDSSLTFNSNTLLMAGVDPGADVLDQIADLREAKDIAALTDLAGSIEEVLGENWRDAFPIGTTSCGIRIGDNASVNFNGGESTIVAHTMFQKRNNEGYVGTGAINVGSGAKLTLTTKDISAGIVNVRDGGVLNTTSKDMNVVKVGKINNSGIVAAESIIIGDESAEKLSGEVNQNAGLMTVNDLVVYGNGRLTVNGGTLSIANTLQNAPGTISLKEGSEVIISSDAIGMTGSNGFDGNPDTWNLPGGINAIANSGGIITVNVSKNMTKLTVAQYNKLKTKILDNLLTDRSTGSIRFGNYELEGFTYEALKDQLIAWDPTKNPEEFANQTLEAVDGGLYGSWQGVTLKQGNHEVRLDGDLKFSGNKPVVKADGSLGGVNTGDNTFTATGDAKLAHVTDGGSGHGRFIVEGHSTVSDINIGSLTVANGASISADRLNVGIATVDGNSSIGHFGSGILFADPPLVDGRLSFGDASRNTVRSVGAEATIEAGQGSIWAIGEGATLADAESALRTFGYEELRADGVTAAAYVSTSGTYQGTLLVTGRTNQEQLRAESYGERAGTPQVYVARQTGLFIDASRNDGITPLFSGDITFENGSFIGLVNVADDFYVQLTDDASDIINNGADIRTDNPYVVAEPDFINNGYGTSLAARVDNTGLGHAVSSMGIHAVARRADSRMAGLIADRAADKTTLDEGLNLWVDAAGERYRSNELAGSSKFRADLAYAAFGADVEVADGFRFGLAVGHTDGSVRSEGIKNSVGGFLVSAYGIADVTDGLRTVADVTYTSTENEVRSAARDVLNNDIDAQLLSAGAELQMPLAVGAFELTPGIGLRVSRIKSDSFNVGAVKINKGEMNLVQMPLTLRVRTDALGAGGWSFTPNARIAFTPSFGDRSVEVRTVDQTVLDMSPFEANFGLTAARGGFSLGAALTAGAGQHGSCSIGGSISMGYAF